MPAQFPKATLKAAFAYAKALARSGGQPLVATALDISECSSGPLAVGFVSRTYGLTGASHKTDSSTATPSDAAEFPTSAQERVGALVKAALRPELFTALFEARQGKNLAGNPFLSPLRRNFDAHRQAKTP